MSKIKNAHWELIDEGTLEDVMDDIKDEFDAFIENAEKIIKQAKERKNGGN